MPRLRFTEFLILVDTHYAPKNAAEEQALSEELKAAVLEFCSVPVLRQVVLCEDVTKLRSKQLTGAGVEIGDKYKRIHVHFTLNLQHQTTVYLKHPDGRTVNREFQEWFNRRLGTSCFVSVELGDTRAKNYATKGVKGGRGGATVGARAISINRKAVEASRRDGRSGESRN